MIEFVYVDLARNKFRFEIQIRFVRNFSLNYIPLKLLVEF